MFIKICVSVAFSTAILLAALESRAQSVTQLFEYDALGRLVTVIDPHNGDRDYGYDPADNRTSVTAAGGQSNNPPAATNFHGYFEKRKREYIHIYFVASDPDNDTIRYLSASGGELINNNLTLIVRASSVPGETITINYVVEDEHGATDAGVIQVTTED